MKTIPKGMIEISFKRPELNHKRTIQITKGLSIEQAMKIGMIRPLLANQTIWKESTNSKVYTFNIAKHNETYHILNYGRKGY